jgi:hypothetical protein
MLATSAICFTLFAASAAICVRRAAGFDKMVHLQALGSGVLAQPVGSLPKVQVMWRSRHDPCPPATPRSSIATPVPGAFPAGAASALAASMATILATTLANSSADHGGSK